MVPSPHKRTSPANSVRPKRVTVIENCLVKFITENVLTDATLKELVTKANVYLKSLANRPKANVTPLRSKVASLKKKIDVLVKRVAELDPSQEGLREGYERNILRHQEEINKFRTDLRTAEKANAPVPPQLSLKRLREYLPELRAIKAYYTP